MVFGTVLMAAGVAALAAARWDAAVAPEGLPRSVVATATIAVGFALLFAVGSRRLPDRWLAGLLDASLVTYGALVAVDALFAQQGVEQALTGFGLVTVGFFTAYFRTARRLAAILAWCLTLYVVALVLNPRLTAAASAEVIAAALVPTTGLAFLLRNQRRTVAELALAVEDVDALAGILPICMFCRRVRDDAGEWTSLEWYVRRQTEMRFSHGVCPSCHTRALAGFGMDGTDELS